MKKIIIGIIILAVVVAIAIFGKQYYDDRYVSSNYYTVVPVDYDIAPKMQYDDSGEEMGQGVDYRLTTYDDRGEAREVSFTIMDKESKFANAGEYYLPGTYLRVSASKQLVTGQETIDKGQIPAAALEKIEANM